ncbi:MAG: long-chain fatty acid--CoA ligase, partial [Gemmatimonadetes bacterium]|nr:long-chain fatty acid--CoA ligase [Gemmatimonadota bacterium]
SATAAGVLSFHDLLQRGTRDPLTREEFDLRGRRVQPSDLASLVYTSGTTGEPKGVMLTHRNFVSNVNASLEVLSFGPMDAFVSFLPLNHCLERTAGYYAPLKCGSMIAYAQSLRRLRENIRDVEPTCLIMVPRIYEGIHQAVMDEVEKSSPLRRRAFRWALKVGRERMRRMQAGERIPVPLLVRWSLAQRLAFRSLRAALGFGRLKHLVSGGAPLAEETAIFFHSAGMPLLEGYGMTEAAPVITFNHSKHWKLGSVGRPLRGVEVRIGAQGEILCRGPNVMPGYYDRPTESAAAIDGDGWLHTGDVGQFDKDGFLIITGRIKDLIVLSNGKKIPPQMVESELLRSPLISQVVAVGAGGSVLGALVVPRFSRLREHGSQKGIQLPEDDTSLARSREALKLIREEVERVSNRLADFERPHAIALLARALTVESGELTPTLKIRRKVVLERHADAVQRLGMV